jgi:phenylalanyl-tRNA synthetase beta chain
VPEQGVVKDNAGPLNLKGILTTLFARLGIRNYGFYRANERQLTLSIGQDNIGMLASLPRSTLDNLGIKNREVWVAEISVEKLLSYVKLQKKFIRLPVYPGISRDISIVLKDEAPAEEILKSIREIAGPLLEEARIADYYKGKQIPPGFKGLTISCLYRSCQRTLTEVEINPIHALAAGTLKEKFSATIR